MAEALDHGPRLSDSEYERRMVKLHEGLPPMTSREAEREVRRRELDILIDHRLGTRFPRERRDALWEAQQRVERKRIRLGFEAVALALLPRLFERRANRLAGAAVREYGKVLSEPELRRFLDVAHPNEAVLPFDRRPPESRS